MRKYILYNPLSGNERVTVLTKRIDALFIGHELIYREITEIPDYGEFFSSLDKTDDVILCGGDGTLNRFLNSVSHIDIKNRVFYYAAGSGNDFLRDLGKPQGSEPLLLNGYFGTLPEVEFNEERIKFVNGIGFGLDGYCCVEGNEIRKKTRKKINYTKIALKGIMLFFKPRSGRVTVDGETHEFKKIWMATAMKGKYLGGGMMLAPYQDRNSDTLTLCVIHDCKIPTLLYAFTTVFKGKHVKFKKIVHFYTGSEISVEYDSPCDLQIDGESFRNVKSYTARTKAPTVKQTKRASKNKVEVPQENEQLSLELI